MDDRVREKLKILADAAKYDVSCASSGSKRKNTKTGLGNATGMGICHTYTEDGRCVSLLKILLTNYCIYDCAYCVSRRSNDVKRAAFTAKGNNCSYHYSRFSLKLSRFPLCYR